MKFKLEKIVMIMMLLLVLNMINPQFSSSNRGAANQNVSIQKIALILDASEFYDSSFIDDVLNGFDQVNQTYGFDYDVFPLYNYTFTGNDTHNDAVYSYYNSTTNMTESLDHNDLPFNLINSDQYDLVVMMGYELRHTNLNFSLYSDTQFLYYDLSGQKPSGFKESTNVLVVSFSENEIGFIAGSLAAATITPIPQSIGMVGIQPEWWIRGEPRSNQLMAGFQSGIFRQTIEKDFLIPFIDDRVNYSTAKQVATDLDSTGYGLIFTALQNNNTLGIIDGFSTGKPIITVDSNRSSLSRPIRSVVKNNTRTLLSVFQIINQTETIPFSATLTYGLADKVFYPAGWGNDDLVNSTMAQLYQDIVENKLEIPTDIIPAYNTSGFHLVTIFGIGVLAIFLKQYIRKKKW
ncbi:MAG: BMP family ABC transporter substrate-binding protein [Candidatus Hodarchaeales archaeon]|jgi:basic membrane lipoprotein Med (substrate-binding protein (PBP1-ABC) superfamily)